jgi:hypothetical protein
VRTALETGQNPYFTRSLIYRIGFNLATSALSPFPALLSLLLEWLLSSIAAYNVVILLTTLLCCISMDQLVR